MKLFLRTRGTTRLSLRSQVIEDSNCFGSAKVNKSLMAFERERQNNLGYTTILTKLFEVSNNLSRINKI